MLKKLRLKVLFLIGCLLFLLGIGLITIKLYFNLKSDSKFNVEVENNNFHDLYNIIDKKDVNNSETTKYIAYLKIPKINLIKGLVDKNSELNTVDKNIQIIKESQMPDIEKSNLILAAHSGNSNVSFFRYLDKLIINDIIYIEYNNKQYEYKVVNCYIVEKTGVVDIQRNKDVTTLTLITCIENTNKQLVVICELHQITNL